MTGVPPVSGLAVEQSCLLTGRLGAARALGRLLGVRGTGSVGAGVGTAAGDEREHQRGGGSGQHGTTRQSTHRGVSKHWGITCGFGGRCTGPPGDANDPRNPRSRDSPADGERETSRLPIFRHTTRRPQEVSVGSDRLWAQR